MASRRLLWVLLIGLALAFLVLVLRHDEGTIASEPWLGTEIEREGLDLRQYIEQLLDNNQPIGRDFETDTSQDFTAEQANMCLPQG